MKGMVTTMGLIGGLAKLAGESVRMKRTANQVEQLDPQTKQWLDTLMQNAQNGNSDAMFELGCYYFQGQYVGYNPDQACFWWTEAANRGNVSAQHNLGLLYHGELSSMYYDENLAGYWFNAAANNGDQEAYDVLRKQYKYSNFRNKWVRK